MTTLDCTRPRTPFGLRNHESGAQQRVLRITNFNNFQNSPLQLHIPFRPSISLIRSALNVYRLGDRRYRQGPQIRAKGRGGCKEKLSTIRRPARSATCLLATGVCSAPKFYFVPSRLILQTRAESQVIM